MSEPLLTVEACFYISGRGTIVEPAPSPDAGGVGNRLSEGHVVRVRLVRPNGTEEIVNASFSWAHFNPGGYRFVCTLPDVTKQVPLGTQIWHEAD